MRERLAGRFLLGRLLRRPLADPELLALDHGRARERAVVRRSLDLEHRVRDRLPAASERLLELGLVVDVRRARVLDPRGERGDDRVLDLLEPVLEEERCRARPRGAPRARCGSARGASSSSCGTDTARSAIRSPSPSSRATTAQLARETTCDRIFASWPSVKSGIPVVELPRDRELEHAVAEELQPLVRGRAVRRPRRVREDMLQPVGRELVDQSLEALRYWCEVT